MNYYCHDYKSPKGNHRILSLLKPKRDGSYDSLGISITTWKKRKMQTVSFTNLSAKEVQPMINRKGWEEIDLIKFIDLKKVAMPFLSNVTHF